MQSIRNYYNILGIDASAKSDEIKRAYRQMARRYHPDVNPGDKNAEEKFKSVGEAYEVLSDPNKRAQYDRFLRVWQQKRRSPGRNLFRNGRAKGADDIDIDRYRTFDEFVDQLLNRQTAAANGTRSPRRPPTSTTARQRTVRNTYTVPRAATRDVEARLTVPLEKAYQGGRERIRLEDGRSLEVNMPAGMVTGQRVRLKGQGIDGGDLYLKVTVAEHAFFQLQGADVLCQVPVTPPEAILGSMVEVPTLDGWVQMNLPPGVRSGQKLRLAGKGFPENGDRGDQIVEIQIVVPKEISPEEKELYEKLREIETYKPRADLI